ncbi:MULTISPECIES: hypothetical protein [unclassified Mesorhizobium]|uniref:hypothetical protein n=1 Tax=unclassified Mesorhizobium TaxID=325217 RepID=UPI001127F4B4|nr:MULTISPECIES: hypothetical protein [unclassified Mesorhizobium]TPJ51753.1 hypothetical protein FJ426_18780 [Mesorhizobium sp. B2-6-4]TPN42375.1 hypothetical protein FJ979_02195 [Mesorhizobium sp. B1-1-6]
MTTITSNFAILDVKAGRHRLARHFSNRPRLGECPEKLRIPIVIHGYIDDIHGHDDGVSQEFQITVSKLETS